MKKIFALALAIVMMMAIALPVFADVSDIAPAAGVESEHVYGNITTPADEKYTNFDNMYIKYGVYQEYTVTIPADVNFGFLEPEATRFTTTRTVSAADVVISGNEYLVVTVDSANTWQMVDQEHKSVNVDYDVTLDNPLTDAVDEITYDSETNKVQTVLVVDHAAGNEGYTAKASGSKVLTFSTEGTAQEGTYLDTLTFTVEITETDPVTPAPVDPGEQG